MKVLAVFVGSVIGTVVGTIVGCGLRFLEVAAALAIAALALPHLGIPLVFTFGTAFWLWVAVEAATLFYCTITGNKHWLLSGIAKGIKDINEG